MDIVMVDSLHPLRFEPIIKRLVWGGRRLGTVLGKSIGDGSEYAESWEISDHRNGVSRVAEGRFAGETLRDLVLNHGENLFGSAIGLREQFPLLVKFIDAQQDLSVQVHPDDDLGRRLANDNGKTETWVIIHAEPDALIYAGLKPGTTRESMVEAIENGTVEALLHSFPARAGDCILIPAGTVHAIGSGVVLAEFQQMSDATFRLHDWNRMGLDGQPRQLHIAESLEAIDFDAGPVSPVPTKPELMPWGTRERLACSPYFVLERLGLTDPTTIGEPDRFTIVLGIEGVVEIVSGDFACELGLGETLLLPASIGPCEVIPKGSATLLTCVVP
jgi:mannose-6-phosphate isomerase